MKNLMICMAVLVVLLPSCNDVVICPAPIDICDENRYLYDEGMSCAENFYKFSELFDNETRLVEEEALARIIGVWDLGYALHGEGSEPVTCYRDEYIVYNADFTYEIFRMETSVEKGNWALSSATLIRTPADENLPAYLVSFSSSKMSEAFSSPEILDGPVRYYQRRCDEVVAYEENRKE